MEAEEPSRPWSGGAIRVNLRDGQLLRITGLSLADPAAAGGQAEVTVWAEVGHERRMIGTLSSEHPFVHVSAPVEIADGEFVLLHDSAASSVWLHGHYLDPPDPAGEGAPARSQFAEDIGAEERGDDEEEEEVGEEYEFFEPPTEEDDAERYDSDNGGGSDDEDEDDQPRRRKPSDGGESSRTNWDDVALVAAPPGIALPEDGVAPLAPRRFAAAGNTAGFMRIAAASAAGSQEEEGREIVVLYRYTRFSRASSGRPGVEACRRTKLHWLRFAVPPAGDMASSLAWAGASLSPLVYPALFRRELQDLWSTLAAPVAAAVPAQAKRLQVVVDAGILRREDHTAERMEHVRGALEGIAGEPWPDYYHVGVELRLPEPVVRRKEDGGDATPPAKRRRMVAEEECCVCLDPLESGLAAWPGCGHVFHGECVEKTLAGSDACPLCRHKVSDALLVC